MSSHCKFTTTTIIIGIIAGQQLDRLQATTTRRKLIVHNWACFERERRATSTTSSVIQLIRSSISLSVPTNKMVSLKSFKPIDERERDETNEPQPKLLNLSASNWPSNRPMMQSPTTTQDQSQMLTYAEANQSSSLHPVKMDASAQAIPSHVQPDNHHHDNSAAMVKLEVQNNSARNVNSTLHEGHNIHTGERALKDADSPSGSSISIVVVQHDNPTSSNQTSNSDEEYTQEQLSTDQSIGDVDDNDKTIKVPVENSFFNHNASNMSDPQLPVTMLGNKLYSQVEGKHFEIVWSNLSYRIEPKWYKKINVLDKVFSHFMSNQIIDNHSSATSTASSSAGINDNQQQMHNSAIPDSHNTTSPKQKSSLDPIEIFTDLNGTIKSGQMTAVLGPSGK